MCICSCVCVYTWVCMCMQDSRQHYAVIYLWLHYYFKTSLYVNISLSKTDFVFKQLKINMSINIFIRFPARNRHKIHLSLKLERKNIYTFVVCLWTEAKFRSIMSTGFDDVTDFCSMLKSTFSIPYFMKAAKIDWEVK